MTLNTTEIVRFTMRLEKPLYEQITREAKQNRRSIAQEIAHRIEQSLKNI